MLAMPGLRRSTPRLLSRRLMSRRLPMRRQRSPGVQAIETLRGRLDQGLQTLTETMQEARDVAGDARLPDAVGSMIRDLAADVPKLPDVSGIAAELHAPDLHLLDAARNLHVDGLRVPDVAMPDVRLDTAGLRALGRRAGSARDAVSALPEYRIRRQSRSAPTGPILGAVLVGMIGGLWLATWPATAPRVRTFLDSLQSRLGLGGGWRSASAREARRLSDDRTSSWRDGPLARRRRRNVAQAAQEDIERGGVAGVAVGPGHDAGSGPGVSELDEMAFGGGSLVAGLTAIPGSPADERIVEHGLHLNAGHAGMPDDGSIPD